MMFKIGDFSRLTRVSLKTLRHYDEIDLFKPAFVDPFTEYRYYSFDQLPRLNRILALKGLGFSLDQIQQMLADDLKVEELRGMLRLRRTQLQREAAQAQEKLAQVEIRLRQIEREGIVSQIEVLLKPVEAITIAGAREIVPSPTHMRERCIALDAEVCAYIKANGLKVNKTSFALYYSGDSQGIDVEMAYQVAVPGKTPSASGKAKVHQLPAVNVA